MARRSPDLWIASVRPSRGAGILSRFATHTLVFQPDTVLHCSGKAGIPQQCPLLLLAQKKAAGDAAEAADVALAREHCMRYTHCRRVITSAEPRTVVVNLPSLQMSVPCVDRAWALTQAGASFSFDCRAFAGRSIVIYVHGFRQSFNRTLGAASHLNERLGGRPGVPAPGGSESAQEPEPEVDTDRERACVLAFLWPASSKKVAYSLARSRATEAAVRLRQLLLALNHAGCKSIAVYAHSMGCRVALGALLDWAGPPIDGLFLAAAALGESVLRDDGEFPYKRVGSRQITVFFSGADDTLRDGFSVAERLSTWGLQGETALGLVGPRGLLPAPTPEINEGAAVKRIEGFMPVVRAVDLTSVVEGHNPHKFLMKESVWRAVGEAVGVISVPREDSTAVQAPAG